MDEVVAAPDIKTESADTSNASSFNPTVQVFGMLISNSN